MQSIPAFPDQNDDDADPRLIIVLSAPVCKGFQTSGIRETSTAARLVGRIQRKPTSIGSQWALKRH
jgi:hypothetical protein